MSLNRIDPKKRCTLRDLLSWNTQDRYELIDGVPYLMTSPSSWHQTVSMNLSALIWNYIRSSGSHCRVYTAPMDLLLFNSEDDLESENIVQPDIFVLCDGKSGNMVSGVPDWIVEVLSPSTARKGQVEKLHKYQQAGVKEYWIADPLTQYVRVFVLQGGSYQESQVFERNDTVNVTVFDDFMVNLKDVFENEISATAED